MCEKVSEESWQVGVWWVKEQRDTKKGTVMVKRKGEKGDGVLFGRRKGNAEISKRKVRNNRIKFMQKLGCRSLSEEAFE